MTLNKDGKVDVVATNNTDNTISVLLGVGDGTFGAAKTFATGKSPTGVATGDIGGDGKVDIVVCNGTDHTFSIFKGNGDGTFTTATSAKLNQFTNTPTSIALADLNNDRKLDAVVGYTGAAAIAVYPGQANNLFGQGFHFATSNTSSGQSVTAFDLNGDGFNDVITGSVDVFLNKGSTTWGSTVLGPVKNWSIGSTLWKPSIFNGYVSDPVDFNSDGKKDIIQLVPGNANFDLLKGTGSGGFTPDSEWPFSNLLSGPHSGIAFGDFNADSKTDVSVVGGSAVLVMLGNGASQFDVAYALRDHHLPLFAAFALNERDERRGKYATMGGASFASASSGEGACGGGARGGDPA